MVHRTKLQPCSGFTLIEILLVMFIVTILAGAVAVTIPGAIGSRGVKLETDRLVAVLQMAQDEAVLTATEIGFKPGESTYSFYHYIFDTQSWEPMTDRPFTAHRMEEGVEMRLEMESQETVLNEDQETPPVLLLSSGEVTAFSLYVYKKGEPEEELALGSDGFAEVKLLEHDEQ